MIGFYNYSVIVTYIGVALSVSGMALASTGQFKFAILCLALAGACDTFEENRTCYEKPDKRNGNFWHQMTRSATWCALE